MVKQRRMMIMVFLIITMFIGSTGAMSSRNLSNQSTQAPTTSIPGGQTITPDEYTPLDTVPLNIKEQMTLSPMFTPDNALEIHASWIARANSTIDIQNQYIKRFDLNVPIENDPSPIIQGLVDAAAAGISIRIQVREGSDDEGVGEYLNNQANIEVRYMGDQTSSTTYSDGNWLSYTHNKLLVVDSKVALISSINFGDAFTENREAGMVVQSATVSQYYLKFFEDDWADGIRDIITGASINQQSVTPVSTPQIQPDTHTDIPKANFTGTYNVSAYVNPDNADQHIFKYLKNAKKSIYVTMYTISRQDFVDTLVNLKKNNPAIDIQVIISQRRVGASENTATQAAALELTQNLIPVYNNTDEFRFTHAKYWIIDQKDTFIYSGNWSPRSVTPVENDGVYTSSDPNRDMGIAVHEAPDIANWVKTEVWDKDRAVADPYELPIGITQNSFDQAEVVSGTVDLSASISGLNDTTVSYSFGSVSKSNVSLSNNTFSTSIDTTTMANGITTFMVTAIDSNNQTFTDSVTVNIANYPTSDNFRLLLTEILPNPDVVSDAEGEFIEVTNSFPFSLLIEGWQVGDDSDTYTFPVGYEIAAYSSIIIARDSTAFSGAYGVSADIELSFSLVNGGDYAILLDQAGQYVDVIAYGDTTAPDGSQVVSASFDAGQSISRSPLHVDTNSVSDFVFADPSPKASVPHIALGASSTSSGATSPTTMLDLSFTSSAFIGIIGLLVIIPIRRRYL